MIPPSSRALPRGARTALLICVVAASLALIGLLVVVAPALAVVAAVLLMLVGVTVYEPVALPVLAMPLFVIVERVGAGGVDLSLSDFAFFGAFWFAVFLGPRPFSPAMRNMLWLSAVYQAATLFTVLVNPYLANTVEWFHAWLLVGGALVVGWAVGRSGHAALGLTLLVGACLVIAGLTLVFGALQFSQGNTGPVYLHWPFGMHKNFIGTLLASAAAIVYARPPWMNWPLWVSYASFGALTLAVAATQARQAYIGLAVAVVIILFRRHQKVRHTPWILAPVVVACVAVLTLVQEQVAEGNSFNSTYQRLTWFEQAIEVWQHQPVVGVGLRWWTTGEFYSFQPPNAELEVLSSTGIVGLVAFLVLQFGGLMVLWRVRPDYGTVAFAILASRLVQGQLDLFWVAVSVSVPYVIAGVCLGAAARADAEERSVEAAPPEARHAPLTGSRT
ncbi:hypothetical protein GCM10023216_05940 [Isoptericola chiayiensis]|uniref:O-antigen ligase-related domain-containing protein n=1 Tax=Isoptericola chiayiensis TaxID=579446 RepID=A0ABP8Y1P2_9MICO|nr:O-antigen ligase family protein [Isoptericola chiayiensis]NOV99447.1 O-antigen ligase [Isoptericola chiayiensis]